jgi:hypothetical protein
MVWYIQHTKQKRFRCCWQQDFGQLVKQESMRTALDRECESARETQHPEGDSVAHDLCKAATTGARSELQRA